MREFHISEAKPGLAPNAKKVANERVRSTVRRVQQSAILGGYWLFSAGRPIFIRTVGKNVRSGKRKSARDLDKLPRAPKPNRTVNTSKQKAKDKVTKARSKRPTKISNIERAKPKYPK